MSKTNVGAIKGYMKTLKIVDKKLKEQEKLQEELSG